MSRYAEAMNLLNEASKRYPQAVSFAAGRPPDAHLHTAKAPEWMRIFVDHVKQARGISENDAWNFVGQYSDTNGIVRELIVEQLRLDEGLAFDPAAIMVTNGAQEAIAIILTWLARQGRGVAAADPTYIGLTGAAAWLGVPVTTVPDGDAAIPALEQLLRVEGRRDIGAFYCIPDHSNPMGSVMSAQSRQDLLLLAREFDFYIIEDVAYRKYSYDGEVVPSLKSMDEDGRVFWVQSYAKTFLPGIRSAALVADRRMEDGRPLADHLASLKSYLSVASSPLAQSILGGFLLEQGGGLSEWASRRVDHCRSNRDVMLAALERFFPRGCGVTWVRPGGGFFLRLDLLGRFDEEMFVDCAREGGVIVVPMSMFSNGETLDRSIRLAFSNVTHDQIAMGVERLARFLKSRGFSQCPVESLVHSRQDDATLSRA